MDQLEKRKARFARGMVRSTKMVLAELAGSQTQLSECRGWFLPGPWHNFGNFGYGSPVPPKFLSGMWPGIIKLS